MTVTTDLRTFAVAAPESDELLSFRRDIFVNRRFASLAGQTVVKVGGHQGSDSVSIGHPPLKSLPDPIPLKIRSPISQSKPAVYLKDIKPKKDATGGGTKYSNVVLKRGDIT